MKRQYIVLGVVALVAIYIIGKRGGIGPSNTLASTPTMNPAGGNAGATIAAGTTDIIQGIQSLFNGTGSFTQTAPKTVS
jgi:hypothetical protein